MHSPLYKAKAVSQRERPKLSLGGSDFVVQLTEVGGKGGEPTRYTVCVGICLKITFTVCSRRVKY